MKSIKVVLVVLFAIGLMSMKLNSLSESDNWLKSIEEAKVLALDQQKPILLVFSGSDWCRPCIMQHQRVFGSDKFKEYAQENLILVQVDFPKKKDNVLPEAQQAHNGALAQKFNPKGYFPTNVIIDGEENELGRFGFQGNPDQFIAQVEAKIKK